MINKVLIEKVYKDVWQGDPLKLRNNFMKLRNNFLNFEKDLKSLNFQTMHKSHSLISQENRYSVLSKYWPIFQTQIIII